MRPPRPSSLTVVINDNRLLSVLGRTAGCAWTVQSSQLFGRRPGSLSRSVLGPSLRRRPSVLNSTDFPSLVASHKVEGVTDCVTWASSRGASGGGSAPLGPCLLPQGVQPAAQHPRRLLRKVLALPVNSGVPELSRAAIGISTGRTGGSCPGAGLPPGPEHSVLCLRKAVGGWCVYDPHRSKRQPPWGFSFRAKRAKDRVGMGAEERVPPSSQDLKAQ